MIVPCYTGFLANIPQWFNMSSIMYSLVICIAKVAVLCLYRRVFSPRRWSLFDLSIVALIVIMVIFYTITCFVKIFECTPREKIYNPSIPGTCLSSYAIIGASGIFNTVTDVLILLLPVRAVWNLKTTLGKKIVVVLAFTFGFWYVNSVMSFTSECLSSLVLQCPV